MANEGDKTPFRMSPPTDMDRGEGPALRRVAAPAAAVTVVAILALLVNGVGAVVMNRLSAAAPDPGRPAGMSDDEYRNYQRGREAGPFLELCGVGLLTLLVYPLAILGGVRMRQLRSRALAVAGAVLIMLPCSPVFLAGVPVGIWALATLNDPAVRAEFR
jgi:hypothetical protein